MVCVTPARASFSSRAMTPATSSSGSGGTGWAGDVSWAIGIRYDTWTPVSTGPSSSQLVDGVPLPQLTQLQPHERSGEEGGDAQHRTDDPVGDLLVRLGVLERDEGCHRQGHDHAARDGAVIAVVARDVDLANGGDGQGVVLP